LQSLRAGQMPEQKAAFPKDFSGKRLNEAEDPARIASIFISASF